ncbi:MAG: hypothetical protein CBD16_05955 [Betaproteobacteria bacterium TMED156]|nr:MAG: hypothetical protein CBD16_05955 [Betaproteobacteria bacterium TMED156]
MFGFINTRPTWSEGKDYWLESLKSELPSDFKILDAPLQVLKLLNTEKVISKINIWFNSTLCNGNGFLIFTSPATVTAFAKYFNYFQCSEEAANSHYLKSEELIQKMKLGFINKRLKLACIGSGTKKGLDALINEIFSDNSHIQKSLSSSVLYVEQNPDAESFLNLHRTNFEHNFLLIFEGDNNKPILRDGLINYSKKVDILTVYNRRSLELPSFKKFYNLITNKIVNTNSVLNFNKKVFLLLTSTNNANLLIKELDKQNVLLNSIIVISHHERIIINIKKDFQDVEFVKILSLSPKSIAEKIRSYAI